ncbi:hypothetical protein BDB01DRAFT_771623 [Pilobolus umbonatus]|nr:hypothetical protein BDB01DRAFT_771623 [Pilobolus umbonatus]
MSSILKEYLNMCMITFESGPNKRVVDDTANRINILITKIENKELPANVSKSVDQLCQALSDSKYKKAIEIHTLLMRTEYNNHGYWILGLKRLIDLTESAYKHID